MNRNSPAAPTVSWWALTTSSTHWAGSGEDGLNDHRPAGRVARQDHLFAGLDAARRIDRQFPDLEVAHKALGTGMSISKGTRSAPRGLVQDVMQHDRLIPARADTDG